MLSARNHNPDVLTCLANLSSDEVFTPPDVANRVLDLLPQEIWREPKATFLDPACKSGVFLREITRRLNEGLQSTIPDQQERINHILRNQVFGLAITTLTALLSRRSVYCSKTANGKYSVCECFDDEQGNIRFERVEHTWQNGRCVFCGANEAGYARGEELETHAYRFIHTHDPKEIFDMQFDVIVSNPPYQLSDGGAKASAIPIYHRFVIHAKKMSPRFITMIIPSRWFAGGRGLDAFRTEMLNDESIRRLYDFPDSSELFPGVDISGGVCYFLWSRDDKGPCEITTVIAGRESVLTRPLMDKGANTFVRYNEAIAILEKVRQHSEASFSTLVSRRKPFGLTTLAKGSPKPFPGAVVLYGSTGRTYISPEEVRNNRDWVDQWKVYVAGAYGERISSSYWVIGKPFLGEPGTCCSETYLVIGPFESRTVCENVMSYIRTRFFRFMVLLAKNTQHAPRQVYTFAPVQDFSKSWCDKALYEKYGLDSEEIAFIESMVRPMNDDGE